MGRKRRGVTTFFIQQEIDTGNIIFQEKEPIYETDNAGSLYERLMLKGAELVLKTVNAIEAGRIETKSQLVSGKINLAPKIFKETCKINWDKTGVEIVNFVRGLSPYPGPWTLIGGSVFKIFKVLKVDDDSEKAPGEIVSDQRSFIHIRCLDSWTSIIEFQPEGKKRMSVEEFFRGNKLDLGL
jgi:methionyl-tRNA formyltransferase